MKQINLKHVQLFSAFFLLFVFFTSCEQEQGSENKEETTKTKKEQKKTTYAEISIKEGGNWEGREYKGGTFKNVNELTLPKEHTDHSYYIRYEGPGWESEKVGYRLYLDWRNAIDIYGKKVDTMVLQEVGQTNFDSYHEMNDWGMDILKAGESLGIGGFGRWIQDSVAHFRTVEETTANINNSSNTSSVTVSYKGWKTGNETIDLNAVLSINKEERNTKVELTPSSEIEGLCTGLVDHGIEPKEGKSENGEWAYISTYGTQTLVDDEDKLGMVLFYPVESVQNVVKGPHDHLLIFKPTTETITYHLAGVWEQEKNGITSEQEFDSYVEQKLEELSQN